MLLLKKHPLLPPKLPPRSLHKQQGEETFLPLSNQSWKAIHSSVSVSELCEQNKEHFPTIQSVNTTPPLMMVFMSHFAGSMLWRAISRSAGVNGEVTSPVERKKSFRLVQYTTVDMGGKKIS